MRINQGRNKTAQEQNAIWKSDNIIVALQVAKKIASRMINKCMWRVFVGKKQKATCNAVEKPAYKSNSHKYKYWRNCIRIAIDQCSLSSFQLAFTNHRHTLF